MALLKRLAQKLIKSLWFLNSTREKELQATCGRLMAIFSLQGWNHKIQ